MLVSGFTALDLQPGGGSLLNWLVVMNQTEWQVVIQDCVLMKSGWNQFGCMLTQYWLKLVVGSPHWTKGFQSYRFDIVSGQRSQLHLSVVTWWKRRCGRWTPQPMEMRVGGSASISLVFSKSTYVSLTTALTNTEWWLRGLQHVDTSYEHYQDIFLGYIEEPPT